MSTRQVARLSDAAALLRSLIRRLRREGDSLTTSGDHEGKQRNQTAMTQADLIATAFEAFDQRPGMSGVFMTYDSVAFPDGLPPLVSSATPADLAARVKTMTVEQQSELGVLLATWSYEQLDIEPGAVARPGCNCTACQLIRAMDFS